MGSQLIFNDTLNISLEQGFPAELVLEAHLKSPISAESLNDKVFEFKKSKIRFYHPQPCRVFLVQNIAGKWLYWGLVHMLSTQLDYVKEETSGTYKIIDVFQPDKMQQAFDMVDGREELRFKL